MCIFDCSKTIKIFCSNILIFFIIKIKPILKTRPLLTKFERKMLKLMFEFLKTIEFFV